MFNEILSVGKKIRRLRDEAGLTQEELAGDTITREFLSLLENNKRKLKPDVAEFLTRKLYKTLTENGKYYPFTISAKTLMEDKKTQAINILDSEIESIENNFNEKQINKLLKIATSYKLYKYITQLCSIATDYYFDSDEYEKAIKYAEKALYAAMFNKDTNVYIKFSIELVANYIELKKFNEALDENKNISEIINFNKVKNKVFLNKINYNFGKIYKNKLQFDLAIEHIKKIDTSCLNKIEMLDVKTLIANCYLDSDSLDFAIREYGHILKYKLDNETKARTYRNLAECYYKKNIDIKAIKYIEMCLKIRKSIYSPYLTSTLKFAADIYLRFKKIDIAENCLMEAISFNKDIEALSKLVNIYIYNNDFNRLKALINLHITDLEHKTLLLLSKLYWNIDTEMSQKLLNMAIENIDN